MDKPKGFELPPVTEHERFRSLSPAAQKAYLALRKKANKRAWVSRESVRQQSLLCFSAVDELVKRYLLFCDKSRHNWFVPRPEYAEELTAAFGYTNGSDLQEMMRKLAVNKS